MILSNPKVKAVLFNIFGGITRCDEVAARPDRRVRRDHADGPVRRAPRRHQRRRGPRRLLSEAALPNVHPAKTMNEAAEKVVALAKEQQLMAVLVDNDTRLAVAGITGREGSFHTLNNRNYGTNVVGGVTPGKGGQDVEGIPVFNSWAECAEAAQPNAAMIFVPPRFAADSILEAAAAGVVADRRDHRGHPRARRAARLQHAEARLPGHAARRARTARASSRPARRTSGSSRRRSSRRATSASSRARAR